MPDKPTVYVETSVIGYLTAWPSRDLVTAARQQITRQWWEERRQRYQLYISQIVLDEVMREIRQARERLLEQADYDPGKLVEQVRDRARQYGGKEVSLPPRPWTPPGWGLDGDPRMRIGKVENSSRRP